MAVLLQKTDENSSFSGVSPADVYTIVFVISTFPVELAQVLNGFKYTYQFANLFWNNIHIT